jgi:spermidine synthase
MRTAPSALTPTRAPSLAALLAVVALFAASGCAALIYQVVWFHQLTLAIGASALSLGVLLATFLGGLGLGSALAHRLDGPRPLARYARLELGIGVLGGAALVVLPLLGGLYLAGAANGAADLALRALIASLALLPATTLMGATLPIAAAWFRRGAGRMRWTGYCYAANTAGAVVGSVLTGFYLLRAYDIVIATAIAVALNLLAAAGAAWLARRHDAPAEHSPLAPPATGPVPRSLYLVTALSGFAALIAEVVWTRHLSLLIGGTVYTYSLIVAVFLLGLAGGAGIGAAIGRRGDSARMLVAVQALLAVALVAGAVAMARSLPYWPLDVTMPTPAGVQLVLDLVRIALVVLPAALMAGASLPLVLAAAEGSTPSAPRIVGGLYAANTLGAIGAALLATFVLVPLLGSAHALGVAVVASAGAAAVLLYAAAGTLGRRALAAGAAVAVGAALALVVPALPPALVAYGRYLPTRGAGVEVVWAGEGLTASIAVTREPSGVLAYHNAGKTQASTYPQDMRLQRMLGHLATLLVAEPRSVFVIGLGTGTTAGAVALDPAVRRLVIAEIEPLVPHVATEFFRDVNFDVLRDPRVALQIDDGRHWLRVTSEKFDAITSDPLDPWVKGAATLYTREFWELTRDRLNEGGVVTAFVQLYESTSEAVRSQLATFLDVFPNGLVFANTVESQGYDLVLVGRRGEAAIDLDGLERRLDRGDYARVARSLREVDLDSGLDLVSTFAAQGRDLAGALARAERTTDRNLRLQYLAGSALNTTDASATYAGIFGAGAAFPAEAFTGSPAMLEELRQRLAARRGDY